MHRLRYGDHGPAVAEIRSTLTGLGFLHGESDVAAGDSWVGSDAVFDRDLDSAVRAFQQQRGLLVDGIVGPATYRSLKEASYRLAPAPSSISSPPRSTATTSQPCSGAYRTSGSTWTGSTATSDRAPTRR